MFLALRWLTLKFDDDDLGGGNSSSSGGGGTRWFGNYYLALRERGEDFMSVPTMSEEHFQEGHFLEVGNIYQINVHGKVRMC